MRKMYVGFLCLLCILLVSGCNIKFGKPHISAGPVCDWNNLGIKRCMGEFLQVCGQDMTSNTTTWIASQYCPDLGRVCRDGACKDYCTDPATGINYTTGTTGCYNATAFAVCGNRTITFTDCTKQGKVCADNNCTQGCVYNNVAYISGTNWCDGNIALNCTGTLLIEDCTETGRVCYDNECRQIADVCQDSDSDLYSNVGSGSCCGETKDQQCSEGVDCNDWNSGINPGIVEICGDGIDNDCDGETDEGCTQ